MDETINIELKFDGLDPLLEKVNIAIEKTNQLKNVLEELKPLIDSLIGLES